MKTAMDLTCSRAQKRLSLYLDRMCSGEEVALIARHIEACQSCALALRDLQKVRHLMHDFFRTPVDPMGLSDLNASIKERTTHAHMIPGLRGRKKTVVWTRTRSWIALAAVLILTTLTLTYQSMIASSDPVAGADDVNDDMTFILQEHALQADQSVFSNGALGSVMVSHPRKK